MRWFNFLGLIALLGCSPSAPKVSPAQEPAEITLVEAKWPDVDRAIRSHFGRVVVIDIWAEY